VIQILHSFPRCKASARLSEEDGALLAYAPCCGGLNFPNRATLGSESQTDPTEFLSPSRKNVLQFVALFVGTAVAQWLRCCAANRKVAGSIPAGVSEFFIDIKFFRPHYGPGVDSASNRNEYQEYFLGVKAAGA